jgi:hypothetical protein
MKNYELRMTNDEWRDLIPHLSFIIRHLSFLILAIVIAIPIHAQGSKVVTIRPDCAAPGMNVVVELLTRDSAPRPFGNDALDSLVIVSVLQPSDSARVMFGPPIVSWNGRLIQIPIFISPNASIGPVPFNIFSALTRTSDTVNFFIDSLQHLGPITHDTTIGDGFGELSASNTLLVDSLIATNATVHFSLGNPDTVPGNPRLLPVVILSKGPVRLTNSTISVDADSLDGGPGGGGGGHGFGGFGGGLGGAGFTGGGSCPSDTLGSEGSDSVGTYIAGGQAATGVLGGLSDPGPGEGGGGGGTGAPYGLSGSACIPEQSSNAGGFGGGSGGGQEAISNVVYGGGGGGFGTAGFDGGGTGSNGGAANGGRFLVPLAGGSGGGAGNSVDLGGGALGASGGGGGGALALISYDSIVAIASTFSARGDSGMSGMKIAAGGGGGSGGAIYVASPKGINGAGTNINVEGGNPGQPSSDSVAFPGGYGGLGRVRIDGASNVKTTSTLSAVLSEGISLTPTPQGLPANGPLQITGFAQDFTNTFDTVRIFYRTEHTAWQSVDTIRDTDGRWAKWLPLPHDSLLYVVAFVEVNGPASNQQNFDYEPNWLVSSASTGIISHPASPFLVVQDTLNFGTVRIGKCKTLSLSIRNEGEALLVIGKGMLSGSPGFSIVPDTLLVIPPYSGDTLEVQFCPDSSGEDSASLTFLSNDSTNTPKVITLLGAGLERHDSLVLSPKSITFDSILVGNCESDTVMLLSAGTDTLYLDQSVWNNPPFSMRLVPPDTALAPKQKSILIVTFCPTDSGDFSQTQVLDDRQDSITMRGVGIIQHVTSLVSKDLGTHCLGDSVTFIDTISDLGNDTVTLISVQSGNSPLTDTINVILQPHEQYPVPISWLPDSAGVFDDIIIYQLSNTQLITTLSYHVTGAEIHFDPVVPFHFVCVGTGDTVMDTLTNAGPDTVALTQFMLPAQGSFFILDSVNRLSPGQNTIVRFAFSPIDTIEQFDTLHIHLSDGGCDSVIAIMLAGTGIVTGLAAESIHFDSVLIGQCHEDSAIVGNPCGPLVTIDSIASNNPAFQLENSLPIIVPALGSAEIKFRFCPLSSDTGLQTDTVTLFPSAGSPFTTILQGTGITLGIPWAHFTISSTAAAAGDTVTTTITLDSSSLMSSRYVMGVISYDPAVVWPLYGFPNAVHTVMDDSLIFSGTVDFSSPNEIESVSWLTLLGPHASTPIGFNLTDTESFINVEVSGGSVTVTDCTGLNGELLPGGDYALGPVTPNPASEIATIALTLGNDGYVEAGLYDMTGKLVTNVLAQNFDRGNYTITIPTSTLASGRYMVVVSSLGWRAACPLVVDR